MRIPSKLFKLTIFAVLLVCGIWSLNWYSKHDPNMVEYRGADLLVNKSAQVATSIVGNAAVAVAKLDKNRPTSGPCKGEKVDNEQQCRYKIVEAMVARDAKTAADNLWGRVQNRNKSDLRASLVWGLMLRKARADQTQIGTKTLEQTAELISEKIVDRGCALELKMSLVEHWLEIAQRDHAEQLLRNLEVSSSGEESACVRGTAQRIAIYRAAILGKPLQSNADLFEVGERLREATFALIYLARVPYKDIKEALVEIGMSDTDVIGEKLALENLAFAVNKGDTQLEKQLLERANNL